MLTNCLLRAVFHSHQQPPHQQLSDSRLPDLVVIVVIAMEFCPVVVGDVEYTHAHQLIHAVRHGEASVDAASKAMSECGPFKLPALIREVLSELSELDQAALAKDANGARSLSNFVVLLASTCPRAVLANLPALETQLEGESYVMRNGAVQAMGSLIEAMDQLQVKEKDDQAAENQQIRRTLSQDAVIPSSESDDEEDKLAAAEDAEKAAAKAEAGAEVVVPGVEARERLISVLLARIHDVNAFTRTKTMQQLLSLVKSKAIPSPSSLRGHCSCSRRSSDGQDRFRSSRRDPASHCADGDESLFTGAQPRALSTQAF